MPGTDQQPSLKFSYISAERQVPKEDPLRAIRAIAGMGPTALGATSMRFYANSGCPLVRAGEDLPNH